MSTLDAAALTALDSLARSMAHKGHHKAVDGFHAYGWHMGWFGTPDWLTARSRFMAAHRQARQAYLDRQARNEWRAA
jgi:hypothetical protein